MYYRYHPYPYYRRYYNLDPYYYRRYYNPYYNYQQNIIDSQLSDIDQSIVNYGDMTDVYQDANVYQSMTAEPEKISKLKQASVPKKVIEQAVLPEISDGKPSGVTIN